MQCCFWQSFRWALQSPSIFDHCMLFLSIAIICIKRSDWPENSCFLNTVCFWITLSGMKHFADCKILFVFDYAVCLLTVPFATFYVRELVKKRQTWRLINPIRWCFVVMFALGIFLVTDFEDFFVKFHEMLFRNSDWMFDPETDPIILALPAEFFMACFILFIILFVIFQGILFGRGKWEIRHW